MRDHIPLSNEALTAPNDAESGTPVPIGDDKIARAGGKLAERRAAQLTIVGHAAAAQACRHHRHAATLPCAAGFTSLASASLATGPFTFPRLAAISNPPAFPASLSSSASRQRARHRT
jgi:hypothetical protein